jgi:hypothetical protein
LSITRGIAVSDTIEALAHWERRGRCGFLTWDISEGNLHRLGNGQYLVGTPRVKLKQFELLDGSGNKSGPMSRCSRWPVQRERKRDAERPLDVMEKALGHLEKRIAPAN